MKKILILHLLVFVIAGAVVAQETTVSNTDATNWKRFTIKGEEFSVMLPTLPSMKITKNLHPRFQKQRVERYLWTQDGSFQIAVFENVDPGQSLDEFVVDQNVTKYLDFTTERDITIDGVRGKEYLVRANIGAATVQLFVTKRRLYRFGAKGRPDDAAVKQFLSAIELHKSSDAVQVSDGPGARLESEPGEKIYTGREVDTKARLTAKPEPNYTDKARNAGITGTVVLKVVFHKTGKVNNIRVAEALPDGLTERCIEAARKIKFIPATKNGKYVSMWMQLEYNFHLK